MPLPPFQSRAQRAALGRRPAIVLRVNELHSRRVFLVIDGGLTAAVSHAVFPRTRHRPPPFLICRDAAAANGCPSGSSGALGRYRPTLGNVSTLTPFVDALPHPSRWRKKPREACGAGSTLPRQLPYYHIAMRESDGTPTENMKPSRC